jgi:hypothetical protein
VNRGDIIRMAREAGLAYGSDEKPLNSVTRFSALVAAAEREACAKACEALLFTVNTGDEHRDGVGDCIDAIRART